MLIVNNVLLNELEFTPPCIASFMNIYTFVKIKTNLALTSNESHNLQKGVFPLNNSCFGGC